MGRQQVRGAAGTLAAAALLAACGCAGPRASAPAALPERASYPSAVEQLFAGLDSVWVEGAVHTEDGSPLLPGAGVHALSRVPVERRRFGEAWQADEEAARTFEASAALDAQGRYRLAVPAPLRGMPSEEIPYRDEEGRSGYVRFGEYRGMELGGRSGGAGAEKLTLIPVNPRSEYDFSLRFEGEGLYALRDSCAVRSEPSSSAPVVHRAPFAAYLHRIAEEGEWARVRYVAGKYGWVRRDEIGDAAARTLASEAREARRRRDVQRRGFPAAVTEAILARRATEGMTPEMVRLAWGAPDREEEVRGTDLARLRWLYLASVEHGSRQVIFEKGRVISVIQD